MINKANPFSNNNLTHGKTLFDNIKNRVSKDWGVNAVRNKIKSFDPKGTTAGNKIMNRVEPSGMRQAMRLPKKALSAISRAPKPIKMAGLALGVTAMMGVGLMRGGMNSAREDVYNRYMQDQKFSRNMLNNSRVGYASGTNSMLNRGGTQGLTLAMSKTRHGM